LIAQVARVEPSATQNFAIGFNRRGRAFPAMLPVPDDAPVVDWSEGDKGAFPWFQYWARAVVAKADHGIRFSVIRCPDARVRLAFRFLNWGAEDCFILIVNESTWQADAARLIQQIEDSLGEPMDFPSRDKKSRAPVIRIREYQSQRRTKRLRMSLVAVITGDDDHDRAERPRPRTGNRSPRPLVTA
jgi:hypothetical protein